MKSPFPHRPRSRGTVARLSLACAGLLIAVGIAACGGGGASGSGSATGGSSSGGDVPTSATKSLANTDDEARALAGAVLGSDGDLASANESFKRVSNGGLSLVAPTANDSGNLASGSTLKTVLTTARVVTKGVTSVGCADVYPVGSTLDGAGDLVTGCTGSITLVTPEGVSANASTLPAGTKLTISYTNLSVNATQSGVFSLNGAITMTVTEALVTSGATLSGGLRIEAVNISGTEDGQSFGPESFTLDMTFTNGNVSLLIDGERIADLRTEFTDEDNFTVTGGTAITDVGDDGYVSVSFGSWNVVGGIPQPGSNLTITGAGGGTATISVTSADATSATFTVQINTTGGSGSYTVVASFANGVVTLI